MRFDFFFFDKLNRLNLRKKKAALAENTKQGIKARDKVNRPNSNITPNLDNYINQTSALVLENSKLWPWFDKVNRPYDH